MKLLLDTHAFLWFLRDEARLSSHARSLIEDGGNELLLSIASAWEMAIKVSVGKLEIEQPLGVFLPEQMKLSDVQFLPVTLPHVVRVSDLPWHHRDPFDRLLIAQSLVEQVPIVTGDPNFAAYGAECLW